MTDLKKLRELAMTCENDPVDFDNALEIFNSYANPQTILKLLDEVEDLSNALRCLVIRLDAIHNDPAYISVWAIAQNHVGQYQGPTYIEELNSARQLLSQIRKQNEESK